MAWNIDGKSDDAIPEVGKFYKIKHARKGEFVGKIISVSGSFADVELAASEGVKVKFMSDENNLLGPGFVNNVSIRDSLSHLTEIV